MSDVGYAFSGGGIIILFLLFILCVILKKTLYGEVDPRVPASILQFHPNVEVFADEAAARLL